MSEVKRFSPRMIDLAAFLAFVLLDAVLMSVGLALYRAWDRGEPAWVHWWLWTFAAPVWTAHAFSLSDLHWPLVWLNPFIYGAVWWFMWRMSRMIRLK